MTAAALTTNGHGNGARPAHLFARDDQGNAERLIAEHGPDMRFVSAVGWHVWDGRRWRRDDTGEAMRRAKRTARALYVDASGVDDDDERKRIVAHAAKSNSASRIKAMLELAQSDETAVLRAADLDTRPMRLNVANGVVDLRTGTLQPHERLELHTKLAPAHYDPSASDRHFEKFLDQVTGGDQVLLAFLQRAAGYTLTGSTSEEVLFFAHGPAATGKSTFLEAMRAMLGDYSAAADFETFLARRGDGGGARSDIARLAGARLVTGAEVDDGKRLAEGLLKQLTGGDIVTARFMYRDEFEFRPAFKLWLAANDRPRARADDDGLWRRILQVPFTHVVPPERRDRELKRHLISSRQAQSAFLAWAVRGCLEWQQAGLSVPDIVRAYTEEYRAEQDLLAGWLEDCCRVDEAAVTAAGELWDSYLHWSEVNRERAVSKQVFQRLLTNHGFESGARLHGGVRGRRGVALIEPTDQR